MVNGTVQEGHNPASLFTKPSNSIAGLIASGIFAALASLLITFSDAVDDQGNFIVSGMTVLQFICLWMLLFCLYAALESLLIRCRSNEKVTGTSRLALSWNNSNRLIKSVFAGALLMLLLWLPWLLVLYPCNFLGDTLISIDWFLETLGGKTGLIYDHNPVLTVYIFGFFAWFGRDVIGNVPLSFFTLVILQSVVSCVAFSLSIALMRRLGLRRGFCIAMYYFYALCPLFPIWNNFLSKDTLFCPFFILYICSFIEMLRTCGAILESPKWFLLMVISAMLSCLFKKLGVYIIVCSSFPAAIWLWLRHARSFRLFVTPSACAVVIFLLMPKIIFPLAGIKQGEKYESISVLLQQTARYAVEYADDTTEEEKSAIDALLGYDDLATRYSYWIVDPVKYAIDDSNDSYKEWFTAWISQGLRHPLSYLRAYIALEKGFAASDETVNVRLDSSVLSDFSCQDLLAECQEARNGLPESSGILGFYLWFEFLPGIELLFKTCIYGVILPLLLFSTCFAARRGTRIETLVLVLPFVLTWGGVWLSPVSTTIHGGRYLCPMICLAPWILAICAVILSGGFSGRANSQELDETPMPRHYKTVHDGGWDVISN